MANLWVDQLITYPVKSLAGVVTDEVTVTRRGFQSDRRWMIVDADGQAVTQRENPVLSQCRVRFEGEFIVVSFKDDEVWLPRHAGDPGPKSVSVTIWDDVVEASPAPAEIGEWFSMIVGFRTSVVYMQNDGFRRVNTFFASDIHETSFTDGFPVLVASSSSLADLNQRLNEPIPISRFRPNVVVSGGDPFEEDHWGRVEVGSALMRGVKPCKRCVMTTIDQATARTGKEPLKTLATYRKWGNNVFFAENFVVEREGRIRVGDPVLVKSHRSEAEVARTRV